MTETRPCESCKGTGEYVSGGVTSLEGKYYPERRRQCLTCEGAKVLPKPDLEAIIDAIKGRKGGLRSARPKDRRAYYVWRMARFHGGADVTMPMCASMEISGDPWRDELDMIADAVAKRAFGTDMAGAHRWRTAFYGDGNPRIDGLPPSAYSGGPVADEHKPPEEAAELT